MTRVVPALLVGVTLVAWPAAQTPPAPQRPTFTANTDVVYVDVSCEKRAGS
jgi:hypothetical protein